LRGVYLSVGVKQPARCGRPPPMPEQLPSQ